MSFRAAPSAPALPVLVLAMMAAVCGAAVATPLTYACTAWGGSHRSRYEFRIDAEKCSVYWRQIDRFLNIEKCQPPVIVAIKPFAPAAGYLLRFNLETGGFSDHVPGWSERGSCRLLEGE